MLVDGFIRGLIEYIPIFVEWFLVIYQRTHVVLYLCLPTKGLVLVSLLRNELW